MYLLGSMRKTRTARKLLALLIILVSVSSTTFVSTARGLEPDLDEVMLADIREIACDNGIADSFVIALVELESNGDPTVSNGNCIGLCQVNPYCHKDRMEELGVTDLYDQEQNLRVACDYLAELFEEYDDPYIVAGIYHGEKNVVERALTGNWSSYQKRLVERSDTLERMKNGVG